MITRLQNIFTSGTIIVGMWIAVTNLAAEPADAELHYSVTTDVIHVDNLYNTSSNEVDDTYVVFSPGVELTTSEESVVSYFAGYTHHFRAYRDNSKHDNDFSDFKSSISFNSGVVLAVGYLTYEELAANTVEVNVEGILLEWDKTSAGGNLRYEMSDLTGVRLGFDYTEIDYASRAYTDTESITVPFDLYYSARPNIDLTAGARLRKTDTFSSISQTFDFKDTFYYVGAVGELFSPKVYGDIKYGYQTRDYRRSNRDEGSSSYDISISYAADPKTSVYLSMSRDYRTSAVGGLAYSLSDFTVGAQYSMTRTLTLDGGIALGDIVYEDSPRAEDVTRVNLGASYRPNDFLTFKARYEHTEVDGNNKGSASNYEKDEFSVSASVRY